MFHRAADLIGLRDAELINQINVVERAQARALQHHQPEVVVACVELLADINSELSLREAF